MISKLRICIMLLAVIWLYTSASILPKTKPHEKFRHVRQTFLDFPCANKAVVNHLFNVYDELQMSAQGDNYDVEKNAWAELARIAVIGHGSNVSPDVWRSAEAFNKMCLSKTPREDSLDELEADLDLTAAQGERLRSFSVYGIESISNVGYRRNINGFAMGVALGIPETEIFQTLDDNTSLDFESLAAKLRAAAEEKCKRSSSGHYFNNENIPCDFTHEIFNITKPRLITLGERSD